MIVAVSAVRIIFVRGVRRISVAIVAVIRIVIWMSYITIVVPVRLILKASTCAVCPLILGPCRGVVAVDVGARAGTVIARRRITEVSCIVPGKRYLSGCYTLSRSIVWYQASTDCWWQCPVARIQSACYIYWLSSGTS